METYNYKITSAKGVLINQLNKEIKLIANKYDYMDYPSQTQIIPALHSVIITTTNYKLIDALIKDKDFVIKEIK